MLSTVLNVVATVYVVVTCLLLLGVLDHYVFLAKKNKVEAMRFMQFILPAIFLWPYNLGIIAPGMWLANRRRK